MALTEIPRRTLPTPPAQNVDEGEAIVRGVRVLPMLDHLLPAGDDLLARQELLRRVDRKFLTDRSCLQEFLNRLSASYRVLFTDGKAWARYETAYFDTEGLDSFTDHLRGRRPRHKVRIRKHNDRGRAFFEVKSKGVDQKTSKVRLERPVDQATFTEEEVALLESRTSQSARSLSHSISTTFLRATILGNETNERITVDIALQFERNGLKRAAPELVIVELKQLRVDHGTEAAKILKDLRIRPLSLSKYCAGVATVHERAPTKHTRILLKRLSRWSPWKLV